MSIVYSISDIKYGRHIADVEAAELVFQRMQGMVPFTLVGKFVAYEIGITGEGFKSIQISKDLPDIYAQALHQLAAFRESLPDTFYRLYPVPEGKRGDEDWLHNLPGHIMSRPYDPLAVLAAAVPHMFNFHCVGRHRLVGNTHEQPCGLICSVETQNLLMRRMRASTEQIKGKDNDK